METQAQRIKRLTKFMKERHSIFVKKEILKEPKPWTKDPILQNYRFCNVYRELDKVSEWISGHWVTPNRDNPDLWFGMAVARLINWPDSLEEIGFPVPWKPEKFITKLSKRMKNGEKVFTGAYMVRSFKMDKVVYLANHTLTPMWKDRELLRPRWNECLRDFYGRLVRCHGLGSFMAAQIIADVKFEGALKEAEDWWTFAASGPGSRRGLNRVLGRALYENWKERDWHNELLSLKLKTDNFLKDNGMPRMCAQNLQNALCEFDKYERVRLGEGTPRSKYNGLPE